MLKAEIVDPNKRKAKIACFECNLSYVARDYKILYENEKLAFFKIKLPERRKKIYCHDCLYKSIVNTMGPLSKVQVEMITLEGTLIVKFHKGS
jgi:hypothetical protein